MAICEQVSKIGMPWFGMDIGGSLVKVVFFDPDKTSEKEEKNLKQIRTYLSSKKAYGSTGKRDECLEMRGCTMNNRTGTLHFIRFATSQMPEFVKMTKDKGFANSITDICATGGGAEMFEDEIKSKLVINLHKTDEFDSLIYGLQYVDKCNFDNEFYYLENPLSCDSCIKKPYNFSQPHPYLVVNIGSGVSVLAVHSDKSFKRISGTPIGGGTFLGLCSSLVGCQTFEEAIELAEAGKSSKVDKLVRDIYGGDYQKFGLAGDLVASSFGNMNIVEKRLQASREDYARGLLEMVTNNIALVARLCAATEKVDRVVFVGNFLRVNPLSIKLLSFAIDFWSEGKVKALFLKHVGYLGAIGCFVKSSQCLT